MKEHSEGTPVDVVAVGEFVRRGRATGALLDDLDDRWEAQSLLDYWATTLDRIGRRLPDAALEEFDPELAPELPDDACPYRGLEAFRTKERQFFFGRTRLIESIVEQASSHRLVPVLGPSGSGKSSVMLAGVLPALLEGALPGSESWHPHDPMVPGSDPIDSLARMLQGTDESKTSRVAEQAELLRKKRHHLVQALGDRPTVLVIDQFEETYTLCESEETRDTFLQHILDVAETKTADHHVFLTMRTDFEGAVARTPNMQAHFEMAGVRVPPLNSHELRDAILKPAEAVGLRFESGLVDQLIHDIVGEPAALPLLQFTLLKLWESRQRNRVTHAAYKDLGGGRSALARSADRFYNEQIEEDKLAVKLILLRLVRPGEGLEVTSKRIARRLLFTGTVAKDRIERVLDKLIAERLVRVTPGDATDHSEDRIEVAHEALVRNWPTLVQWLDEERATLRHQLQFTSSAQRWHEAGRPKSLLLQGHLLEEARHYDGLDIMASAFVRASNRLHTKERRWIVAVLSTIVVVLAVLTTFAFSQRNRAQTQAELADARLDSQSVLTTLATSQATELLRQADSLLQQADTLRQREARLQVLAGDLTRETGRATAALENAERQQEAAEQALDDLVDEQQARQLELRTIAIADSLATLSEEAASLDERLLLALAAFEERETALSISALFGAIDAAPALLVTYLPRPPGLADGEELKTVAFGPNSDRLFAGSTAGSVFMWESPNVSTGRPPRLLREWVTGDGAELVAVAVSPTDSLVAAVGRTGTLYLWNVASPVAGDQARVLGGRTRTGEVRSLVFDRAGERLVTGGHDLDRGGGAVAVWDLGSGDVIARYSFEDLVIGVDFDANDERIVVAPYNGPLATVNQSLGGPSQGVEQSDLVLESAVLLAAHPSNPDRFATASAFGLITSRSLTTSEPARSVQTGDEFVALGYSAGDALVAGGNNESRIGNVRIMAEEPQLETLETLRPLTEELLGLAVDPSGWILAGSYANGRVAIWRLNDDEIDPVNRACLLLGREPTPEESVQYLDARQADGWICDRSQASIP